MEKKELEQEIQNIESKIGKAEHSYSTEKW